MCNNVKLKGIYLAACKALHYNYDMVYQDIDEQYKCDLGGNMLDIDTNPFDYVIATPPCNWCGRHTYISNIVFDLSCLQHQDFVNHGVLVNNDGYSQGGSNVHVVIDKWLAHIHTCERLVYSYE